MKMARLFACLLLFLAPLVTLAGDADKGGKCPDVLGFQGTLNRLTKDIKVISITDAGVADLCEVVVDIGLSKKAVIYTDKSGSYAIIGEVISLKPVVSLVTKNRVLLLNSRMLPSSTVNLMKAYTDMVYNEGASRYIYFVADPDCPYCKEAGEFLERWAKERGVEIRVILFPLAKVHPEAVAKSVSMICEGKGWDVLRQGGLKGKECEEGKRKIEQNEALMERLGVSATPAFIGMNGLLVVGMPQDAYIFEKLIDMRLAGE